VTAKSIRGAIAGLLCTARLARHRPPDPRIIIAAIGEKATSVLAEAHDRIKYLKPRLKSDTGVILAERWDDWTQPSAH
jgi:hypothetical protein